MKVFYIFINSVLLSQADSLLTNVTLALNLTRQSRIDANETLTIILSRDFTELVNNLDMSAMEASSLLLLAQHLFDEASENHEDSVEGERTAEELDSLLRIVLQLLTRVISDSEQAMTDSTVTRSITGMIRVGGEWSHSQKQVLMPSLPSSDPAVDSS